MNWREFWESLKTGMVNVAIRGAVIFGATALFGWSPQVLVFALGATGVLGAYRMIKDKQRHERNLLDQFRPEIAAETGKAIDQVGIDDLYKVAEHQPVLRQSLNEKDARLLTNGLGMVAAVATTLVIGAQVPFDILGGKTFFDWVKDIGIQPFGQALGISIGGTLIAGTVLSVARSVFSWAARGIFGGDKTTIAERIEALEVQLGKGLAIQPEQTFSVAIAANPELGRNIEKAWGKRYEDMPPLEQCVVLRHYPANEQVQRLTDAVNMGNVYPAEIGYAILGRSSGVAWDPVPAGPKVRQRALDLGALAEELPDILSDGPSLESLGGLAGTAKNLRDYYRNRPVQPAPTPQRMEHAPQASHPPRPSFVSRLEAERASSISMQRGM